MNQLHFITSRMNHLRVNSIDEYQKELMGYNIIGNKIVYLTETDLCVVRVGKKFKKESAKINGCSILNFVISRRGYLAFLYKNRTVEIRRMDNLNDVMHRFTNITLFADGTYPKMKWDYDQLYLIYPENLEILDVKTKTRRGYTDIVVDYENQKMVDMVIANIMDSERAVILQLANRLIFTIIPIPVTELEIPFINSVLNLYSPSHHNDSRREFIAVLSNGNMLRIINFLNLKQISEIDLEPKAHEFLQMESDAYHECILIRYISSATLEITKNVVYKINSGYYYCENYNYYGQREPFFIYKFEIPINENLTLFPATVEQLNGQVFDYYHLVFFKKGHLYSVFQFIPHSYSQTPTELKLRKRAEWKEAEQWKQILATYLELTGQEIPKQKKNLSYADQERQLQEYNIIKQDFDNIIAKFTAKINEESKVKSLNQKNIQDQWDEYMAKIAKQRNFLIQTMKLFKIQPQVIKKGYHQRQQDKIKSEAQEKQQMQRQIKQLAVAKELESCMRQIQGRQERIDAKIKERKKEIEVQKKAKPQTTKEEIQKYQEDYQKFVAEFMLQNERKEKQQQERKAKQHSNQTAQSILEQRLILTLPNLNQQEKRILNNFASENLNNSANNQSLQLDHEGPSHLQSCSTKRPYVQQWNKMERILKSIEQRLQPFIEKMDPLIDRLKNIEVDGLNRIKVNEAAVKAKCSLNLEEMVKNCCKQLLSNLSSKIKKQIDATTREIYRLEDKNKIYYEDSIQKFKEYIHFQIENRIEIYYKSRRRLQTRIAQMSNELSDESNEQN